MRTPPFPHLRYRVAIVGLILLPACGPGDAVAPSPPTPRTGTLEVTNRTSGVDPEGRGYVLVIRRDGQETPLSLPVNAGALVPRLSPGAYQVRIRSVPPNCQVAPDTANAMTVVAEQVTTLPLVVTCTRIQGFLTTKDTGHGNPWIHVTFADGSTARALAAGITPAWSPSGDYVVFAASPCQRPEDDWLTGICHRTMGIHLFGIGGPLVPLTAHREDRFPAWNPRDGRIAFLRGRNHLYSIVPGEPERLITALPVDSASHLSWSPDGRTLAFGCAIDRGGPDPDWTICFVTADGSGFRHLTPVPGKEDGHPAWHPDGSRLAVSTTRFGAASIAVMPVEGGGPTWVAEGRYPTWLPDGRLALVGAQAPGEVFVTSPGGGVPLRIGGEGHLGLSWRPGSGLP